MTMMMNDDNDETTDTFSSSIHALEWAFNLLHGRFSVNFIFTDLRQYITSLQCTLNIIILQ